MSTHDAPPDLRPSPAISRSVVGFALWFVDGAVLGLGVASILTIGLALLAVGAIGLVFLVRNANLRGSWPGLVGGPAAALVLIAYLNRSGPGQVCTTTSTSESCTQEYSPWPFLVVGLLLFAGAVALEFRRARRARPGV